MPIGSNWELASESQEEEWSMEALNVVRVDAYYTVLDEFG